MADFRGTLRPSLRRHTHTHTHTHTHHTHSPGYSAQWIGCTRVCVFVCVCMCVCVCVFVCYELRGVVCVNVEGVNGPPSLLVSER